MEKTLSVTLAKKEDIPAITRLINDAYRGDPASPGWTAESQFMDGDRIAEADISRLMEEPGADMPGKIIKHPSGLR